MDLQASFCFFEESEIQMAIYLKPNDEGLTIADKRYIFAIRNRMINLSTNFPSNKNRGENCTNCGERETSEHIYTCDQTKENNNTKYEEIFGENLKNMKTVYLKFKTNYEKKEIFTPGDPLCDPLSSFFVDSNGNKS